MTKESSSTFIEKLEKIVINLIILIGMVMLVIALAHIFWRYVLNNALTWSEELLKILLIWFAMLCTTIISKDSGHIGIVVFREMMPKKTQRFLLKMSRYMMLVVSTIVTGIGIYYVMRAMGQYTPSLGIPYSLAYAAIPVGFAIMAIYEANHIKNKDFMDANLKE